MYDKNALRRKIAKDGLQETLKLLSSDNFPEDIKAELSKDKIFVGGYPCLSIICSL